MSFTKCYIGCAGWNLPKDLRDSSLSRLERYAQLFNCVEINSSFYRHHQAKTYARWAESVPDNFRFSVKIPKTITHKPENIEATAARFLNEVKVLGEKLGPLLMQFPPKRVFDSGALRELFLTFRENFTGKIVCEPRHASWFQPESRELLELHSISLVGADPKPVEGAPDIFNDSSIGYFRLHGSPRIYYSDYSAEFLDRFKNLYSLQRPDAWVIFDNTALGFGYKNALTLCPHGSKVLSGI